MSHETLRIQFEQLHEEAERLAGGLSDLARRATVYRHIFVESKGNHAFPLIAAHGALWAGGYFRFGMKLGALLAWQYAGRPELRKRQLERLAAFADAFREINRRVCVDTYVNFHFTRLHGQHPFAGEFVSSDLLGALNRIHAAAEAGVEMSDEEKQSVFETHFRHEQKHVVGPRLTEAVAEFDWPLVKWIALQPVVRFAFFPRRRGLWFHNFASQEERIEKGLAAFEIAAEVGWENVDAALQNYQILPAEYFATPAHYFREFRTATLAINSFS